MTYKYMYKKIVALTVLFVMSVVLLTACKKKPDSNGSMISDDGRSYGGVIETSMDKEMSNSFFKLKIDEAKQYDTYQFEDGLYKAADGNAYVVLKVTIKNTFGQDLPMSISDFVLDYDGNKERIVGYGNADLMNPDFMDNVFTLKKDESITKYIMYTVKAKEEYSLKYVEYYEDKFEGDTYLVKFKPVK